MNQLHRLIPALLGDIEVVGGVAEHIEAGDIAAVAEVVERVVGAHGVIGVHMQVGVQRAQCAAGRVNRHEGLGATHAGRLHLGGQTPLAHRPEVKPLEPHRRPPFIGQGERLLALAAFRINQGQHPVERQVAARVAPGIVDPQQHIERLTGADQARHNQLHTLRRSRHDVQQRIAWHLGKFRAAQGVDKQPETEVFLDETLHPRARPALATVAQANSDLVAGIQVAVDDVDDDRFLERPFVTLLVEAHFQVLHGGLALPGDQLARLVLGADVVGTGRVRGLEQCPIGVELERQFQPGAIRQAAAADLVDQGDFIPLPGNQRVSVTVDATEERAFLVALVEALGGDVMPGFAGIEYVTHMTPRAVVH